MARNLKDAVKMFKAIKNDLPNFFEDAVKEAGVRFLSIVIPLTPVQENYTYRIGQKTYDVSGGALKRGWIGETEPGDEPSPSEIEEYVRNLRTGGFKITIANTVEYALNI